MRPAKGRGARQRPLPDAEIADGEVSSRSPPEKCRYAGLRAAHKTVGCSSECEPADGKALPITITGSSARPSRQLGDQATSITRRGGRGHDASWHIALPFETHRNRAADVEQR